MITVGYGDFHPVNTNERIYVVILTLFSCAVFGYAGKRVGSIIGDH